MDIENTINLLRKYAIYYIDYAKSGCGKIPEGCNLYETARQIAYAIHDMKLEDYNKIKRLIATDKHEIFIHNREDSIKADNLFKEYKSGGMKEMDPWLKDWYDNETHKDCSYAFHAYDYWMQFIEYKKDKLLQNRSRSKAA